MIKRIVFVFGGLILIASLRPVYLIGVSLGFWQPLTRPTSIPTRARYVDTLKSDAWFDCSIERTKDVNICRAWDSDGNLIASGNYRLDGENRAATAPELRPSQVHLYSGHPNLAWIYLFGDHKKIMGKTLVPVNDAGEPLERFEVSIGNDNRSSHSHRERIDLSPSQNRIFNLGEKHKVIFAAAVDSTKTSTFRAKGDDYVSLLMRDPTRAVDGRAARQYAAGQLHGKRRGL